MKSCTTCDKGSLTFAGFHAVTRLNVLSLSNQSVESFRQSLTYVFGILPNNVTFRLAQFTAEV